MSTRPLDRLTSIRVKLGSVIVFAVAVTILMMYVGVGFAVRRAERDRQFRELLVEARAISALGFNTSGRPSVALQRAVAGQSNLVVAVDARGKALVGDFPVPSTVGRALAGQIDNGTVGKQEYLGVPITRSGQIVGAIYLAHRVAGGGLIGAIQGTATFVGNLWWKLLLAGAVAGFIALFLARILARGMTTPLRDMAQAARRMARGDYGQRVKARSRDEVGQLAEAFNRMAGEMESLERLRRDLVANVSHELKTPISALRARLENLLDGVEQPDPMLIAVMLQQTERLSRLVDQLLELSRLESGDVPLTLEPVELSSLVEQVVNEVEVARAGRGIHVRNLVSHDLPLLEADRERLHQVLFNLLDNAFRFSQQGGQVTVRADRENGSCQVSVEDNGPGIPAEHLPFVFERFYRVDQSRSRHDGGTGIGLAIARSVVEAHGGRIWAESHIGEGSRFRFVLPLAVVSPEAEDAAAGSDENVLQVADHRPSRGPGQAPVVAHAAMAKEDE
jgi:signal transduction histidine kinase